MIKTDKNFAFVTGIAMLDVVSSIKSYRHIQDSIGKTSLNIGGRAYNIATFLKKIGVPVTFCSAMNNSPISQVIANDLFANGIRTHILIEDKLEDSVCNSIFHRGHEVAYVWNHTLDKTSFDETFISKGMKNSSCLILTNVLPVEDLNKFIKIANEEKIPTLMVVSSLIDTEKIAEIDHKVDYIITYENQMNFLRDTIDKSLSWNDVARHKNSVFIVIRRNVGVEIITPDKKSENKILSTNQIPLDKSYFPLSDIFTSCIAKNLFFENKPLNISVKNAIDETTQIVNKDKSIMHKKDLFSSDIHKVVDSSFHDELTGALNYRGLNRFISNTNKNLSNMHILAVDVNDMNSVNKKYGRQVGDEALVSVSKCIKSDLRNNDFIVRLDNNDSFLCMLQNIKREQTINIAKRIIDSINNKAHASKNIKIDVMVVITELLEGEIHHSAIKRIDQAFEDNRNKQPSIIEV